MTAIPATFWSKLQARLKLSDAGVSFLRDTWQPREGGMSNNTANWNPLNTTQQMPGSSVMGGGNSAGVQAYGSEDQGVEATAKTLENGYYNNLLSGLRTGQINGPAVAPEIATWGTKSLANELAGGAVPAAAHTTAAQGVAGQLTAQDPQYAKALAARQAALDGWAKSNFDDNSPFATQYEDAAYAVEQFESVYGKPSASNDPAQQAFENGITLGDYESSQGKLAYDRYADKSDRALTATSAQIAANNATNQQQLDTQKQMEDSKTPGLITPPSTIQYRDKYQNVLQKYQNQFGVGAEPPLNMDPLGLAAAGQVPADTSSDAFKAGKQQPDNTVRAPGASDVLNPEPSQQDLSELDRYKQMQLNRANPVDNNSGGSNWWDKLGGGVADAASGVISMGVGTLSGATKKASRWFQGWRAQGSPPGGEPGGVVGIGEAGPEIVKMPDGTTTTVTGPMLANLPKGAVVIPKNEAYQMSKLQGHAATSAQPDPAQMATEIQSRRNDPGLAEKVLAAIQDALAGRMAVDPPATPELEPGVPDLWADRRKLTGIPANAQLAAGVTPEQAQPAAGATPQATAGPWAAPGPLAAPMGALTKGRA